MGNTNNRITEWRDELSVSCDNFHPNWNIDYFKAKCDIGAVRVMTAARLAVAV